MRKNIRKFKLALTAPTLLVLLLWVFAALPAEAGSGTAYVDEDATCGGNSPCFSTIQAAINNISEFDTIVVYPGIYVENLIIRRSLTLTTSSGFLARDTIIDGSLAGRVIDVRGTELDPIAVTVEGFVIKNGLAAYGAAPGDPMDGSGAGIGARYATMTIRGNQIRDNGSTPGDPCLPATLWGGGISLDSGSGSVIEANFIEGNNAADYTVGGDCYWDAWGWGGGIAIILSEDVLVINNFITDNWTVYDGGGILIETANVKVIHNTIRGNAIDTWWTWDGGMCIESGDGAVVEVVNTICWSDAYRPGGYDREFHLWAGGTMTVTYSDIRDGSCPGGPCTGNVIIDPDFVNSFDSHLNVTSPLIDIAVASTVTDDIDEDTRPQGAAPDIGADEVVVDNEGPITSNVVAMPNPVAVNTEFALTAIVDDSTTGNSNIYSAEYNIVGGSGGDMSAQDGAFDGMSECVEAMIPGFLDAGVYEVCVRGTDAAGNTGPEECIFLVVYDLTAGFVTGGGWIMSPEGAYKADPLLTGKANFGFFSRYKKGANVPTGNTEFQFNAGDLNFHSSSYDWLVVTGSNYARFKGTGTINGSGEYKFMLWAGDGEPDTFRIRIWTEDEFGVVETVEYDNGTNQAIGGGSIVIHTKK